MTTVDVSPARRDAGQAALAQVRRLSLAGLDAATFLDRVNPVLGHVVRNRAGPIEDPYWYLLDPQTELVTSVCGHGCGVIDLGVYMRWDLLADDVLKTADVVHHPRGVLTLHEATGGEPRRSPIYQEVMVPAGMAQELMVALRSPTGETWGVGRLNREPGEPMFDAHEIGLMQDMGPLLADGVRRGLLLGEAADPDRPDAPAFVVLSRNGDVESLSPTAEEWFDRLPGREADPGHLPPSVISVAAATVRSAERAHGPGGRATARVRTRDGGWALVHGTVMGRGSSQVTVLVEWAHPDHVAPLLMTIYGLTGREQEVTRQVLRGGSTADVAHRLSMSPATVQQHLKSIFAKADVSSRGALVAKVWFDCYDERARDNQSRASSHLPLRGGPVSRRRPSRPRSTGSR